MDTRRVGINVRYHQGRTVVVFVKSGENTTRELVSDQSPYGGPATVVGGVPYGLDAESVCAVLGLGPHWEEICGDHGIEGLGEIRWSPRAAAIDAAAVACRIQQERDAAK